MISSGFELGYVPQDLLSKDYGSPAIDSIIMGYALNFLLDQ
jgi:hypothetical protein